MSFIYHSLVFRRLVDEQKIAEISCRFTKIQAVPKPKLTKQAVDAMVE